MGQLSAGFIFWVDGSGDLMVRQVVGDGVLEMGWEVAEGEIAPLDKTATQNSQ